MDFTGLLETKDRLEDFNNGKSIVINVRKASKDPLRYLIDSDDFVYCGDYVRHIMVLLKKAKEIKQ